MAKFIRKGKAITTITINSDGKESRETEGFNSINLAKKASFKLQISEGGLGLGSLTVE